VHLTAFELTNIQSVDRRMHAGVEAFLFDNPDPGVRIRPREELDRALATGWGFVLTNATKICGVSLVYNFDVPPSGPTYSEIGTMRITANGFGLQTFLANFHLHQIRLEEDEPPLPNIFAVVTPDTASEHNLEHTVGMVEWTPPKELGAVRGASGVPFAPTKRVLNAPPKTFATAAHNLRNWHTSGNVFRTPKGDGLVHINMGWFTPATLAA
jgi:hypothetical protein